MNQTIPQHLIDEFSTLVKKGDEQKVRRFLIDHLKEFPEESKNAIITAFVEEALTENTNGNALIANLQKEGLDVAASLDAIKDEAEKQEKLIAIKKDL